MYTLQHSLSLSQHTACSRRPSYRLIRRFGITLVRSAGAVCDVLHLDSYYFLPHASFGSTGWNVKGNTRQQPPPGGKLVKKIDRTLCALPGLPCLVWSVRGLESGNKICAAEMHVTRTLNPLMPMFAVKWSVRFKESKLAEKALCEKDGLKQPKTVY